MTNFTTQLQGCFVVVELAQELAGLILPAVIVAAQRKISGQFATIGRLRKRNLWSLPFLQHRF
jgi:hypothetical protein